jgi:membrane-associated phospholipid phosphatase
MAARKAPEPNVAAAGAALEQEARFGARLLHRHGWRLLLVFAGLLLPLWGFAELADEIREQEAIAFDEPVLKFAHTLASAGYNRAFVWISDIGYLYGVVPFDVALVLVLTLRRWFREATFAAFALAGSGLLNVAVKHVFARVRPSLWESIAPETTFSFPSGHAMGSATLACVVILLAWRTRWRWPRSNRRGCRTGNARRGTPATARPAARTAARSRPPASASACATPAGSRHRQASPTPLRGRWGN